MVGRDLGLSDGDESHPGLTSMDTGAVLGPVTLLVNSDSGSVWPGGVTRLLLSSSVDSSPPSIWKIGGGEGRYGPW